jgi:hypothetical protein
LPHHEQRSDIKTHDPPELCSFEASVAIEAYFWTAGLKAGSLSASC